MLQKNSLIVLSLQKNLIIKLVTTPYNVPMEIPNVRKINAFVQMIFLTQMAIVSQNIYTFLLISNMNCNKILYLKKIIFFR